MIILISGIFVGLVIGAIGVLVAMKPPIDWEE